MEKTKCMCGRTIPDEEHTGFCQLQAFISFNGKGNPEFEKSLKEIIGVIVHETLADTYDMGEKSVFCQEYDRILSDYSIAIDQKVALQQENKALSGEAASYKYEYECLLHENAVLRQKMLDNFGHDESTMNNLLESIATRDARIAAMENSEKDKLGYQESVIDGLVSDCNDLLALTKEIHATIGILEDLLKKHGVTL